MQSAGEMDYTPFYGLKSHVIGILWQDYSSVLHYWADMGLPGVLAEMF